MDVRRWILKALCDQKIDHIFMVPGAEIDPICSVLEEYPSIKPIVACHEEGAGFMADGYARVKNGIGCCMVIGGPGAANTIPALLNARADCSRLLLLSGGSAILDAGRGTFQNTSKSGTNDAEMLEYASLYSQACDRVELLPVMWRNALLAMQGLVPGPVHLTLMQDFQSEEMHELPALAGDHFEVHHKSHGIVNIAQCEQWIEHYLKKKTKIVFLIGRGVRLSGAEKKVQDFIEKYQIPFASTMGGKGIIAEDHPLYLGIFGSSAGPGKTSHKRALEVLSSLECEVIIALGSSFFGLSELARTEPMPISAELVQVDIAQKALGRNFPVHLEVQADVKSLFDYVSRSDIPELIASIQERTAWLEKSLALPLIMQSARIQEESESGALDPAMAVHLVNQLSPANTLLFVDTGVHSTIGGHFWLCGKGGSIFYSSNLGAMGFAIPAAIGGKMAAPDQPVVVLTGDGCMRMHGIELMTAVHYNIPIIILVSNNSALGNVYLRARTINEKAKDLTMLSQANWAAFSQSLGGGGMRVTNVAELKEAYRQAVLFPGPFVIDVITKKDIPFIE